VKQPEQFWSETIPRLSDLAVAALLYGLGNGPKDLPTGVVRSEVPAWESTRFAWAAQQITSELASAAGTSYDAGVGLLVVWSVATAELPRGPGPARHWGRAIAMTRASWVHELAKRLGSQMRGATQEAFREGLADKGAKIKSFAPLRPRPRADPFEADLVMAKALERQLRVEFADIDDLGDKPSSADRRAFVGILAAGYTTEQVMDALRGRADKCRRSRRWRDIDTGQVFLRLTWICAEVRRFIEAEQVGASLSQDTTGIVVGEGGRKFVGGREVYE
jgi:hypothetical protein